MGKIGFTSADKKISTSPRKTGYCLIILANKGTVKPV